MKYTHFSNTGPADGERKAKIKRRFADYVARGLLLRDAAKKVGMSRITLWNWEKVDRDFHSLVRHACEYSANWIVLDEIPELEQQIASGELPAKAGQTIINSKYMRAALLSPERYGKKAGLPEADNTIQINVMQFGSLPQAPKMEVIDTTAKEIETEPVLALPDTEAGNADNDAI